PSARHPEQATFRPHPTVKRRQLADNDGNRNWPLPAQTRITAGQTHPAPPLKAEVLPETPPAPSRTTFADSPRFATWRPFGSLPMTVHPPGRKALRQASRIGIRSQRPPLTCVVSWRNL